MSLADELARFDPDPAARPPGRSRTPGTPRRRSPTAERRAVFGDLADGRPGRPGRRAGLVPHRRRRRRAGPGRPRRGRCLRAFFNVCRHRAAPLLNEPCGDGDQAPLPLPRLDLRPRRQAPRHAGVRRRRRLPQGGQRPACRWPSRSGGRSSGSTSTRRSNRSTSSWPAARSGRAGQVRRPRRSPAARVRPGVQLEGVRR